ncbi:MAG: gamma-butyrobetaine hydroxylase-like domain-containing protein [Opitutales bacterium]
MTPKDIQLIGSELAIVWEDGSESYFPAELLRRHSPSAENIGEKDILGNQYGGDGPKAFPDVTILSWELVGNYAIRPSFSDGHKTGLFSWKYLRELDG